MQNFRDLFCKAYRKRKTLTRKRKEHEIDPRRKQEKAREVTVIDERNKQTNKQKKTKSDEAFVVLEVGKSFFCNKTVSLKI